MTGYLNLILRLIIWFLLTADFGIANIIIGVCVALILPRGASSGALKDWLRTLGEIIIAIPQAYMEAIEIMLRPHEQEAVTMEKVKAQRNAG
ncbi:MAG: cation:proton antiporter, partial [Acaryochloridaceae cyanobacterium SU_2_1]|nr:cation:proton antiporter [Acaryochloridaceae cyanobacterium SU_2_1]